MINSDIYLTLIGKEVSAKDSKLLFDYLNNDSELIVHEPFDEDIIIPQDNWKSYESNNLGLFVEVVNSCIASISFSSGFNRNINKDHFRRYGHNLPYGFTFEDSRNQIRNKYGDPVKESEVFDQYYLSDYIVVGVLFNPSSEIISFLSFGYREIFSNPDLRPNRISLIFDSLS